MILASKKPKNKFLAYLKYILVFIFFLSSAPLDADFGWHFRYGEYMATHLNLLSENIYSFTMVSYSWNNTYWMSQLLIYLISNTFGFLFLTVLFSFVFSLLLILLFREKLLDPLLTLLLTLEVYVLGQAHLSVRPMFFSSVFIFMLLYILFFNKKLITLMPLIFLFWVNFHADFFLGLFILAIYTLVKAFEAKSIKALLPLVFSFIATLINPYSYKIYSTLLNEFATTTLQAAYIGEWKSLWGLTNISIIVIFLLVALVSFIKFKKYPIWLRILVLALFFMSIKSVYFIRIFIVLNFFIVSYYYSELYTSLSFLPSKKITLVKYFCTFMLFLLIPIGFMNFYKSTINRNIEVPLRNYYPVEAVNFINENKYFGNTLNMYSWGGYLIWKAPNNKVLIDGRMPSWHTSDDYVFKDYTLFAQEPFKYSELLNRYIDDYAIEYAVVTPKSPLKDYLIDVNWQLLYVDDVAVVLRKD